MNNLFVTDTSGPAVPVWCLTPDAVETWCSDHPGAGAAWVRTQSFTGEAGRVLLLPDEAGGLAGALLGLGTKGDALVHAALSESLPAGTYRLVDIGDEAAERAAFAWALGTYSFDAYRKRSRELPKLVLPATVDAEAVSNLVDAIFLARDLINTPACDMGPAVLADRVIAVGERFGAEVTTIVGDALLTQSYPMVHAVGRAADASAAPRLIDLTWGDPAAPKVTLVGKGVCFDTGGLNLKPDSSMALMKKDMGGAANTLALAQLIMAANLPVRLRLMIPAVENAVAGNAFRPGDVLQSRKGLTVEIGNTDAEGRLILADALAEADSEKPDLLIDMATLTGAARVATGPDLPPFFTHDEALAADIAAAAQSEADPVWRLPLWGPYDDWLKSKIADVSHISESGFAGSITAALFLNRFVEATSSYVHFDIYGWNQRTRPGRPIGGEAQGIRALMAVLEKRYR